MLDSENVSPEANAAVVLRELERRELIAELRGARPNSVGCLDKVSRMTVVKPDDLLDSLREENEALLVRVAHLEATRDEYRRQMEGLLTSSSWRVTAPLRSLAAGFAWPAAGSGSCPSGWRLAQPLQPSHRRTLSARSAATGDS